MADDNVELLVREGALSDFRFVTTPLPGAAELASGEILVRIEKFGFSANNVTYAVVGRTFRYFEFFPAADEGWGKVNVWGMGAVTASRHPELKVGARMYGYFPLARAIVLKPARMAGAGFEVDRGDLPLVYNQYALVGADPFHVADKEDAMMVLRPLFFTGLLLDDFLAEGHDYFGADAVMITSASAKTSYTLAFSLARRRASGSGRRVEVIGLTSERNAAFVSRLGFYDRIVTYEQIAQLPLDSKITVVDIAGDADVLARVGARLGDNLRQVVLVGASHWDKTQGVGVPPAGDAASRTQFFFAPAWVAQRQKDWGAARFVETLVSGWRAFMADIDERCRIVRAAGPDAVADAYRAALAGGQKPDEGQVLSLWDDAFGGGGGARAGR